ncbi:hypothetical protein AAHC03_026705 [Spirometra sp. Aus1]
MDSLKENLSFESIRALLKDYLSAPEEKYLEKFAVLAEGVRYLDFTGFLIRNLQTVIHDANSAKIELYYERIIRLLEIVLPVGMPKEFLKEPPNSKSDQARRLRIPALRHSLTELWTQLLDKELSDDLMLDALKRLGDGQLRRMTETRLLSTYVTPVFDPPSLATPSSWSRAVARTMLSLIQFGGLNYDRLYPRLYRLLDYSLLSCPYADRFLIDLDVYLSSLHLPAATVAAFAKRLAQLGLEAPLWMLPALLTLIANCLNRHQTCRVLVNRPQHSLAKKRRLSEGDLTADEAQMDKADREMAPTGDPYDWDVDDFNMTGALDSSLWEIACLEQHYHPEVAALAKRIRQLGGPTQDFLPDVKNQVAMGKEISEAARKSADRSLTVLRTTNARLPPLPALDGWIDCSQIDETKTQ